MCADHRIQQAARLVKLVLVHNHLPILNCRGLVAALQQQKGGSKKEKQEERTRREQNQTIASISLLPMGMSMHTSTETHAVPQMNPLVVALPVVLHGGLQPGRPKHSSIVVAFHTENRAQSPQGNGE